MACHLFVQKNEVLVYVATWMNFENVTLSIIIQTQKCILYGSIYMKCLNRQIHRDRRLVDATE